VRNGYNVKNLCELLNAKPREINAFIRGQLPPERTQQLSSQLLAVEVRCESFSLNVGPGRCCRAVLNYCGPPTPTVHCCQFPTVLSIGLHAYARLA
jgi:hypothetical protein